MNELKCKVVLLPADIKTPKDHIGQLFRNDNGVISYLTDLEDIIKANAYFGAKPQHLYFVSERELNSLDIYYEDTTIRGIGYWNPQRDDDTDGCFKIEASTYIELDLPIIPQSFLRKFAEKQGEISEVTIEMERIAPDGFEGAMPPSYAWQDFYEVKTNSDNTVVIKETNP